MDSGGGSDSGVAGARPKRKLFKSRSLSYPQSLSKQDSVGEENRQGPDGASSFRRSRFSKEMFVRRLTFGIYVSHDQSIENSN